MAATLFTHIPPIVYRNKVAPNIFARFQLSAETLRKTALFHTYQVEDGDRPDTIAFFYYGNSNYDWIVMFSNQIVNLSDSWPLTNEQFTNYLTTKYGSVLASYGAVAEYKVINTPDVITEVAYNALPAILKKYWTGITTVSGNTGYIRIGNSIRLTPDSYDILDISEKVYWEEVSAYDYEFQVNEDKRNIRLIDAVYVQELEAQLRFASQNV